MTRGIFTATLFIAATLVTTGASAQKVYKCGQAYSQTPCAGAEVVDASDPRTAAQQKQTRQAASRDANAANAMEKARVKQEKADLAANAQAGPLAGADAAPTKAQAASASKQKKSVGKEPEFFTAKVLEDKKAATQKPADKPAVSASKPKKAS